MEKTLWKLYLYIFIYFFKYSNDFYWKLSSHCWEEHIEEAVERGERDAQRHAAQPEDGGRADADGQPVGKEISAAERHVQEEQMPILVEHLEEGAQRQVEVGCAVQRPLNGMEFEDFLYHY